jgi:ribosome modulation factor
VGIRPMPAFVPPPPPVSEERKQEILADPRVQAQQKRDSEVHIASSLLIHSCFSPSSTLCVNASDEYARTQPLGRLVDSPVLMQVKDKVIAISKQDTQPKIRAKETVSASLALRKAAVKQWINGYRERSAAVAVTEDAPKVEPADEAAIQANKEEAQAWIAGWRASVAEREAAPAQVEDEIGTRKAAVQEWINEWRARSPAPMNGATSAQKAEVQQWIANWRASSVGIVSICPKGITLQMNEKRRLKVSNRT